MVMFANEVETKEKKISPEIKINYNIYMLEKSWKNVNSTSDLEACSFAY